MKIFGWCSYFGFFLSLLVTHYSVTAKSVRGPRGKNKVHRELWVHQVSRISPMIDPIGFKKHKDKDKNDDADDNGQADDDYGLADDDFGLADDDEEADEDDDKPVYEYDNDYMMAPSSPTRTPPEDGQSEGSPPVSAPVFTFPPFFPPSLPDPETGATLQPTMIPSRSPVEIPVETQRPTTAPEEIIVATPSPTTVPEEIPAETPIPTIAVLDTEAPSSMQPFALDYPVSTSAPQDDGDREEDSRSPASSSISVHASCQAARNGEVYVTPFSETVYIKYELLTTAGVSLPTITTRLDKQFKDYVALYMVDCSLGEDSDIQGVDTAYRSTVTEEPCENIRFFDSSTFFCFQIKSALTIFLSENTTMTITEIQDEAYLILSDGINGPPGRRLGYTRQLFTSKFIDTENGIVDLYFLDNSDSTVNLVSRPTGDENDNSTGRAVSASAVGFGVLALSLMGGMWYRRRRADRDEEKSHGRSIDETWLYCHGVELNPRPEPTPSELTIPQEGSNYQDEIPATSLFEAYEATTMEDGDQLFYRTVTTNYPDGPQTRSRTQEVSTVPAEPNIDELVMTPPQVNTVIPVSKSRSPRPREKSVDPPASASRPYSVDLSSDSPLRDEDDSIDTYGLTIRGVRPKSRGKKGDRGDRSSCHREREHDDDGESTDTYGIAKYNSLSSMTGISIRSSRTSRKYPDDEEDSTDTYGMSKHKWSWGGASERRAGSLELSISDHPMTLLGNPEDDILNLPAKEMNNGDDSFSVSAFLNGHAATLEGFYDPDRHLHSDRKIEYSSSKKRSPTSLTEFWSNHSLARSPGRRVDSCSPKRNSSDIMEMDGEIEESSYCSGYQEVCSVSTRNTGKAHLSDDAKQYFHNFSPYGEDYPHLEEAMSRGRPDKVHGKDPMSTDSMFGRNARGRDRTPAAESTNSGVVQRRSKTSSVHRHKDPPARRIINDSPIRSLSSEQRRSCSRGPPVPRFHNPGRSRASDAVSL